MSDENDTEFDAAWLAGHPEAAREYRAKVGGEKPAPETVTREVAAYHARPEIGKAPTAPWQPPTCDAGHVTRAGEACSTCAPDAATDVETTVERLAQEAKARHAAICDRLGPMSSAVWDYVVRPMATENAALRIQFQNERSSPVWAILGEVQAALGLPRGALLGEVVAAARDLTAGRRKAAQTLIAEIGAAGPENIEETAERAAAEIRRLNAELAKLGALKSEEVAPAIERFREAFGADVPQAPSGKRTTAEDMRERAAQEAERALIEYAEIDVLDKTPERIRIARRIRALPLCAVPDEPFEVAPPVRHARHDRHCMIGDGVGCSHEAGCEVEP